MLAAQHIKVKDPREFISSGSFGTMGFSIPAAIGAHYANPDIKVIAIDGDGSLRMNMGELHTIGQYNLPVKILLLNNHSDGMVKMVQKATYPQKENPYTGTCRPTDVNFSNIAKECGFTFSLRINKREEISSSIKKLIDSDGPGFLEVICDPLEEIYPRIPGGKHYKDMVLGPYMKEKENF